jgi:hypothetical protein
MHIRAARAKPPTNARHLGANGCWPASVPAIGSAATREHNGSIVLPNRAIRGWVDLRDSRCRRADLLSPARRAHDAGESRVAVRGAGSAARGDQHALAIGDKAAASRVLPGAAANRPTRASRWLRGRRLLSAQSREFAGEVAMLLRRGKQELAIRLRGFRNSPATGARSRSALASASRSLLARSVQAR